MQGASDLWFAFRKQAVRSWLLRWRYLRRGVYIGEGARIPGGGELAFAATSSVQRFAVLNARKGAVIRLGPGSRIGAFAVISAGRSIDIGPDVLIADRVFITDHHHGYADSGIPVIKQDISPPRPVSIGAGCWLGVNVCVLPGVALGPGCIVGAGSVVTGSFPAGSIVGGVPARLIRSRSSHGA
jgi:acetyltransferase-like isoleucine patch superfamily enzyme